MRSAAVLIAAIVATASAVAQSASKGKELTLFASTNLKGTKRVVAASTPNLGGIDADNFAWSLSTKGRWEVCMDAGYRAGCRVVTGDVRDLGTDGGAITSVRYLEASGATYGGPATAAPAAAESGPSYAGYVYETDFNDLTITSWTSTAVTGRYEYAAGRIEGTLSGSTLTGYWLQEASPTNCGAVRGGTPHWGQFTFAFNADRTAFTGRWGDCGDTPSKTWNGRLVRKTSGVSDSGSQPAVPGVFRRVGQRAGDAAERSVGDEAERRVGNAIGRLFGGE